jgi:hypothetical protein
MQPSVAFPLGLHPRSNLYEDRHFFWFP